MKLDKLREIAMAARQGQWETRVVESWNSDDPYALSAVARTHRQSPRQGEQRDKANADADGLALVLYYRIKYKLGGHIFAFLFLWPIIVIDLGRRRNL